RCTDDCIAFAKMLISDLGTHGDGLKKRFDKLFRSKAPMIQKPLFDKAERRGLMPDPSQYADWDTMFVKPPPEPSWASRWRRRLAALVISCRLIGRRLRTAVMGSARVKFLSRRAGLLNRARATDPST